jgi:hypothetical protein
VIGGMLAATFIAIFIIPAMFYFVERISHRKEGGKPEDHPTHKEDASLPA